MSRKCIPMLLKRYKYWVRKRVKNWEIDLPEQFGTGVRPIGRLDPERPPSYLEVSHKAVNRPVTIKNQYSEKYSAGGDNGVVNGIRGTIDFHDGNWQGYEGVDFEAIIDLGATTVISEIRSSFLQISQPGYFFQLRWSLRFPQMDLITVQ